MTPTELDALYAFLVAAAVAAVLTPLTMRLARRVGAIDQPRERGLSDRETPRLGGLAIFAAAAVAGAIWLPHPHVEHRRLAGHPARGVALITLVGALDDRFDFHPAVKLAGQIAAAVVAVGVGGIHVHLRHAARHRPSALPQRRADADGDRPRRDDERRQLLRRRRRARGRRLRDRRDRLRRDRLQLAASQHAGGVLAALTAGAALGFLVHNFPPASSFMGDAGSNLLGLLMGCDRGRGRPQDLGRRDARAAADPARGAVPRHDVRRAQAPEVPPPRLRAPTRSTSTTAWRGSASACAARVLFFYGWTLMLAGYAVALRFIHYSDGRGHLHLLGRPCWSSRSACSSSAASVYLIYVLEILKFNRRRRSPPAPAAGARRGARPGRAGRALSGLSAAAASARAGGRAPTRGRTGRRGGRAAIRARRGRRSSASPRRRAPGSSARRGPRRRAARVRSPRRSAAG